MTISDDILERHGLTREEYQRIVDALKREPTLTELGIFSVMWSEHCSYKSSRVHLKTLPTAGPRVLQGPGENAGAVDIGDGLAAVFKIESHNHPSFIEPYQGAATGVGGIIRDIFTMRISCPPTVSPCFYGVDTPRRSELIAATHTIEEIRKYLDADSVAYLSLDGLTDAVRGGKSKYCTSCYTGVYPVAFPRDEAAYLQLALKLNPEPAAPADSPVAVADLAKEIVAG